MNNIKLYKWDDCGGYAFELNNAEYIIYKDIDGFSMTTLNNYNSRIVDTFKITRFKASEGFKSLNTCIEYINKYF